MEVLVRQKNKLDNKPACFQKFDIITIQPDDWLWSFRELVNPDWRILQVDNINEYFLKLILAKPRNYCIDINSEVLRCDKNFERFWKDDNRYINIYKINQPIQNILRLK